ncbi:MAG: hypothetical protein WB816_07220 [Methylocystis sp.]
MRADNGFAIVLVLVLAVFAGSPALAKGGWHYYDPDCPVDLGGKKMKFVASQPKSTVERFCDAIPDTGPAVIALDAPDSELREMIWDIRILRDKGKPEGEEDRDADSVFRLPPEKHGNGMVNFDAYLRDAGDYILLVELVSADGQKKLVGRHHFTAGVWEPMEIYTVAGFAAVVLLGGAFAAYRYLGARGAKGA